MKTIAKVIMLILIVMVIKDLSGDETNKNTQQSENKSVSVSSVIDQSKAENGRKLFIEILSDNPTIDRFYYSPSLAGGITEIPTINLNLPSGIWDRLSLSQQDILKTYASSEVINAWINPFKYSPVTEGAPVGAKLRKNAKKMTIHDWAIYEGKLTNNGRDIISDRVVARGK
ncbi:MAG: hypothetical protein L3J57_14655 [Desulfuromusa sp.]|nr:hypothetical protein [Desulfuromusa sp.]